MTKKRVERYDEGTLRHLGTPRLQPWVSQSSQKDRGFSPWGMPCSPTAANAEIDSIPIPRTTHVSESGGTKNKVEIRGMFSALKNTLSPHHIYHAFHHNFTTKTPHPTRAFS